MLRTTIIATAAILAAGIGAAQAQSGPVITGGGDNMTITYDGAPTPRGNVVGGGVATIAGGGDNQIIAYGSRITPMAGEVAWLSGGGDNMTIVYAPKGTTPDATAFASRIPGPRG
jgi:hypothetical protein